MEHLVVTYDSSELDEHRIRLLARKASAELASAGIPTRAPRFPLTKVEKVRGGFLRMSQKEQIRVDDGGRPRFWVVTTHVMDGIGHAMGQAYRWSTEGRGLLLSTTGELLAAAGHANSKVTEDWVYTNIRPADASDILWMDNKPGGFKGVSPLEGERWREVWARHDVPGAHVKGAGATVALWALLGLARGEGHAVNE